MSFIKKLDQKIKDFEYLNENVGDFIVDIMMEYEAEIVDLNSEDQLYTQGVDADNVQIQDREPYTPYTVRIKRLKGQPTNRVTTRDAGDFHRGFYLERGNKKVRFWSKDEKTEDLVSKYGESIFGLIPENKEEVFLSYVRPGIIEIIKAI